MYSVKEIQYFRVFLFPFLKIWESLGYGYVFRETLEDGQKELRLFRYRSNLLKCVVIFELLFFLPQRCTVKKNSKSTMNKAQDT